MNKNFKNSISMYINAKDNNKPHLMNGVFSTSSILEINLMSENISFPRRTKGLKEITKTLVSDFNKSYENIYTICLEDSIVCEDKKLDCVWLVIMSEKQSNKVRIGFGSYSWQFNNENQIEYLNISIEKMEILDNYSSNEISYLVKNLSYPWCDKETILKIFSKQKDLDFLKESLKFFTFK